MTWNVPKTSLSDPVHLLTGEEAEGVQEFLAQLQAQGFNSTQRNMAAYCLTAVVLGRRLMATYYPDVPPPDWFERTTQAFLSVLLTSEPVSEDDAVAGNTSDSLH